MKLKKYQKLAMRTAPGLSSIENLTHAALGLASEVGEFTSPIKADLYYGADFDRENLEEELGDILWYITLAADALNMTLNDIAKRNIAKLRLRYPEKFTTEDAITRADKHWEA